MKKMFFPYAALFLFTIGFSLNANASPTPREFYLIQIYHCSTIAQVNGVDAYLKDVYLPYMHNAGIQKIGVFAPVVNDTAADKKVYVWLPMKSLEVLDQLDQAIEKLDPMGKNAIVDLENADSSLPYTRLEKIVSKSFKLQGQYEKKSSLIKSPNRIYEFRSYESPTENAHLRKVHMFNEGGEIDLFKRLNFNAVFYSKVIIGSRVPNLIYMTSFNDMADRDAHWKAFSSSPEWKVISTMPKYLKAINRNETVLMTARDYADF
jgi:hypothetical protein